MAAFVRFRARRAATHATPTTYFGGRGHITPLIPVLALALALAACTGSGSAAPSTAPAPSPSATAAPTAAHTMAQAFPVTIHDDEGTPVSIAAEPHRIVSLTPAATEILFAIGAGDRVVAKVEDINPYPPEADGLPVVATFQGVDIEQIVALRADLVIAGGLNFTPPNAVSQLRSLGIPVVVLYAESIDEALAGIRAIGVATGETAAAEELSAATRTELDRLGALTADLGRPTTFYEIDATSDIYTVPADSLYAELLVLAGADPITTDASYQISLERLITANPSVILLGDGGYTTAADVASRPGWSGIQAVIDGNIVVVDDALITRPGPRLVEGLRALIRALHPEVAI